MRSLVNIVNNITFIFILSFVASSFGVIFTVQLSNHLKTDIPEYNSTQSLDTSLQNVYSRKFNQIGKEVKYFQYDVDKTDFRAIVFDKYFEINNSPLKGFGRIFVEKCEKYNAPKDCTILVAIAKVETDLCNYLPSQDQKNCWGFGGAGENRYVFSTYTDAIDLINNRLVNGYGKYNMTHPNNMEVIYCGNNTTCLTWGERVQESMDELNNLSVAMGYTSLYSLRTD